MPDSAQNPKSAQPTPLSRGGLTPSSPKGDDEGQKPEVIDQASELLRPLLRDANQAPQAAARLVAVMESHSGPIHHPQVLEGIDRVVPGGAREIIDMAKAEQRHRHTMESLEIFYPYLGLGAGFVGLLGSLGGSVFLAMHDKTEIAAALLSVPLLGAVGWLVKSRISRREVEAQRIAETQARQQKAKRRR